jgi:hypothetical protein
MIERKEIKSSLVDVRKDLRRKARRRGHVGQADDPLAGVLRITVVFVVVHGHGAGIVYWLRDGVALLLGRELKIDEGIVCTAGKEGKTAECELILSLASRKEASTNSLAKRGRC